MRQDDVATASPATGNRFDERRRRRSRAALLEAAIALFQEKGIRTTRLEEICARADIAPRTFFNHFETRERLYEAIARQRAEQLANQLDALRDDPRALGERLNDLFTAIGAYLGARPLYRELVGEMLHLRHDGGTEAVRARILGQAALRFIRDGVARGEIARRHPPEVLADLLLGALVIALGNWSASEEYDLEEGLAGAAAALVDLFAAGDPARMRVATGVVAPAPRASGARAARTRTPRRRQPSSAKTRRR
jgi:AcrR family transcriptional regulator